MNKNAAVATKHDIYMQMAKTFVLGVHRHMHREVVSNFALDLFTWDQ